MFLRILQVNQDENGIFSKMSNQKKYHNVGTPKAVPQFINFLGHSKGPRPFFRL